MHREGRGESSSVSHCLLEEISSNDSNPVRWEGALFRHDELLGNRPDMNSDTKLAKNLCNIKDPKMGLSENMPYFAYFGHLGAASTCGQLHLGASLADETFRS